MDMYPKYTSPFGYQTGVGGIDTYGVNHNNFSLRDEVEYQFARDKREQELMKQYNAQGITENYPQYGTNFWGNAANNYGFGNSNISANIENRTEKIAEFLKKMSSDKKWKAYDGHYVNVQTVLTLTAAKLEKQFKKLNSSTTVDVRLANLLEFKKLMEEHNREYPCSLIQKILELIERESDMLQRGRPDSSLEGLRQRLNNLYLNFIETPTFNPEAQRFQIIPKDYLLNMYKNKD